MTIRYESISQESISYRLPPTVPYRHSNREGKKSFHGRFQHLVPALSAQCQCDLAMGLSFVKKGTEERILPGFPMNFRAETSRHSISIPPTTTTTVKIKGPARSIIPFPALTFRGQRFHLSQMHGHWGSRGESGGSEHLMDGRRFLAEVSIGGNSSPFRGPIHEN